MKINLLIGITLIGAMALSSCAVNRTASNSKNDDDVYFSNAKAGDEPEYVAAKPTYRQDETDQYNDDDDYYYYDDYATRINRFSYYSPFNYCDSYYSYSPYYYGSGLNLGITYNPWYSGWGLYGGIGLGYGAYSPYAGYGYGYGYGYPYYYSPYSYWGTGYYNGGYPYWGVYSAYNNSGTARPFRGTGAPRGAMGSRTGTGFGNNGVGYYPGRPTRGGSYGNARTNSTGGYTNNNGGYSNSRPTRATRNDAPQYQPRPVQVERTYSPPPSNSGGSSGGGGGSSSGGGGGGRPSRP